MTYAHVGELSIWYERRGQGPRVLFISGSGGDLRTKPNVFDGPLGTGFDVLAYDQRGLGQSSKPDEPYTMADYGNDAAGLLAVIGWDSCAVVGVSFGGMVAQELAIRHPDRVERLVLCCTSSGGAGQPSFPLHTLVDLPDEERRSVQLAISDTRYDQAWQVANPDDAARLLETMAARETSQDDGYRRQLAARADHDTFDRLDQITAPTFIAAGRYDGIAPVANSEALGARIPDSHLHVYDGGHLFLLQDRTAWRDIKEWLLRAV